ncbi:RHS repeat-associated core domain-containing protein [Nocardia acidivorans]|uniref:RHS repeat-associated core domain-containing protein n=1 Tax=Nocardia acidivorans TaxID=404580 RepID=UPI0014709932|nr:RHS repeat-associated core domain-containing protein [Nocardia acidivorans]
MVKYTDVSGVVSDNNFDPAGRLTKSTTTVKGIASVITYSWDDASQLTSIGLDGNSVATPGYTNAGELASVAYANGSRLDALGRNSAGVPTALTWKTKQSTVVDTVTRSRNNRITDDVITADGTTVATYAYTFDAIGRLVGATVPHHQLTYRFDGANGCGPAVSAGNNTNRTSYSDVFDGGAPANTTYCYDNADRLLSTSGATALSFAYDNHGSATQVGGDQLGYDATNRHISTKTSAGTQVAYKFDSANRLIARTVTGAAQQADNTSTRYGYGSASDSADVILDANGAMVQRVVKLPGGVLLTKKYGQSQSTNWSYPNLHGDILFTADGAGTRSAQIYLYDPYGQNINPLTGAFGDIPIAATAQGGMDYGYLGEYQRPVEHVAGIQSIEMGVRTYLPILGRFLQVDPIPGGSANAYDYVSGDPVNNLDLAGTNDEALTAAELAALAALAASGAGTGLAIGIGLGALALALAADSPTSKGRPNGKDAVAKGDWQHVKDDHTELNGKPADPTKGIFEGSEKTIKDRIAKAIEKGFERSRTDDRREFDYDFGERIGREGPGNTKVPNKPRNGIKVVIDKEGKLVTAHPI